MFSEKSKLTDRRENPFYGSYRESSILEEIHWKNKKKRRQLAIAVTVIILLTVLGIGITLSITLPKFLEIKEENEIFPPNPKNFLISSDSTLNEYNTVGISSEDERCSNIGREILEKLNGSAVDAAVGIAFCHGVVAPQSSGIGGGLFITIYDQNRLYTLNGRESVPENVFQDTFTNQQNYSFIGGLSVGIPGEVLGLWNSHSKFGKVPWRNLVKYSRDLASTGFSVSERLANSLEKVSHFITSDNVLSSEFMNPSTQKSWVAGDIIKRPRLAKTLEILESDPLSFYNGTLAEDIALDILDAGGILDENDLRSYNADWVDSITMRLHTNNLTLATLGFPSSGPVIALALGILDGYGSIKEADFSKSDEILSYHRLLESLKFAETHRAQIFDPNFDDSGKLDELLEKMLSTEYHSMLRNKIKDFTTENDGSYYGAIYRNLPESGTSHISVITKSGDAVSLTSSINTPFGAGFMGNRTGIIFNNQLRDFSFPNKNEIYSLPINPFNNLEPGKQPASSMTPLIFLNSSGFPVLSTGGSGGSSIIPALISTSWSALYRKMNIKDANDYPRFLVNFLDNHIKVHYEFGFPSYLISDLERKGHSMERLNESLFIGNINSVCVTKLKSKILANSDYRKHGGSAGF